MVIAVTGASGQLGQALQGIAAQYPQADFVFASSEIADITQMASLESFFIAYQPEVCINAAAYTAVDKAESEPGEAFRINAYGAGNLAHICKKYNTTLIHLSTDFVFDGKKGTPYTENDVPCPESVYGKSKLEGEQLIQHVYNRHFIIRTSWVYSQFGHNFMKTMLRLGAERNSLKVVNDQMGTPTNATDLARALVAIALSGSVNYGIYNYSNEGQCSWFDFAVAIFEAGKITIDVVPTDSASYSSAAKRPAYSVLNKQKIKVEFGLVIPEWKESLNNLLR